MNLYLVLCAAGGYLAGSIPFGLVLCYLAGYGDIRKIGSGNIGATNVLRTGNKTLALLTVLLDAFKAGLAAYAAGLLLPEIPLSFAGIDTTLNVAGSLIAGSFGVIGHNFPVWLKFKGGKGVSSAFGFILMTQWPVALIALAVWLAMAFAFRFDCRRFYAGCCLFYVSADIRRILYGYCSFGNCPPPCEYSPPAERHRKQNQLQEKGLRRG